MCGINAIFDLENKISSKARLVAYMNQCMVYRGPDGEGIYDGGNVVLGMRRLSIIDVEGGDQPIYNETGDLIIVCNGEIYNYIELMQALKQRGHHFSTGSDVEVILHLYEEKGVACLEELRGMYSFVLWDSKEQRLFAARDRLGIKPLYVQSQDGVLWLSSELKSIVGAAAVTPILRPESLYQFLCYGYALDQRNTLVDSIWRVLPGEYLLADVDGMRKTRYWELQFGGDTGLTNSTDQEIFESLQYTINIHLRSDVPVGVLLSGGIDSSALAAYAAKSSTNYTALCAGYIGSHSTDERPQAHATAEFLKLSTRDVMLDPASYETNFDELINFADEPIGDPAAMAQWELYKQARQLGYKVLLSGIGGDEVFFGYPAWNKIGEQCRSLDRGQFKTWAGFDQSGLWRNYTKTVSALSGKRFKVSPEEIHSPLFAYRDAAPQGPDAMASILYNAYLVHNGCQLADKLGMGCSVEVRVPFVDHVLMQNVFSLPLSRRFDPNMTKPLLKRLLRGTVPDGVIDGQKRGFTPPRNFVGELVGHRIDQIRQGALVKDGWVEPKQWESLCNRSASFGWIHNHTLRRAIGLNLYNQLLFHALSFEAWHQMITTLPKPL